MITTINGLKSKKTVEQIRALDSGYRNTLPSVDKQSNSFAYLRHSEGLDSFTMGILIKSGFFFSLWRSDNQKSMNYCPITSI